MAVAHGRLCRDFLFLRDAVSDPASFFQHFIDRDPNTIITFDMLAYYATLFDWDSSLNFRAVIEGSSSVAAWLASNKVPLSVAEPDQSPRESPEPQDPPSSPVDEQASPSAPGTPSADDGEKEDEVDVDRADAPFIPGPPSPSRRSKASAA